MATLSGGFGFLAASLAALGLYGVMAYMVARRANEIGVRIALGADSAAVIRLVLREAVLMLLAGMIGGAVFSVVGRQGSRQSAVWFAGARYLQRLAGQCCCSGSLA